MKNAAQALDQSHAEQSDLVKEYLHSLGLVPRAEFLEGPPRDLTEHEQDQWYEEFDGQFVNAQGEVFRVHSVSTDTCSTPPQGLSLVSSDDVSDSER